MFTCICFFLFFYLILDYFEFVLCLLFFFVIFLLFFLEVCLYVVFLFFLGGSPKCFLIARV